VENYIFLEELESALSLMECFPGFNIPLSLSLDPFSGAREGIK
jgi:hypothetical protein